MPRALDVLLLGGSGLIGSACARALVAAGHRVTVVTRGRAELEPGCAGIVADRGDERSLAAALTGRRADFTLDFLAYDAADVRRALDVPRFSPGRYAIISTGQVYLVAAEPRPPFVEADAAKSLMSEPEPGTRAWHNWVYGVGKRAAEAELAKRRGGGLEAVALRLPVVQGARDGSRRLWAYLQRMLDGGPLLLPEGGLHPVRFVWTEDVARAVVRLASLEVVPSPAYNLAMPDEPSLAEFLLSAASHLRMQVRFVECSWAQLEAGGLDPAVSPYSGSWCSRPDPELALRELGCELSPSTAWLQAVVEAHLAEASPAPHPGYALRQRERQLAREWASKPA